jgi:hypothetical protein
MAILAMCFDLMQEEIVAKFRWLGRKMGIVENDSTADVDQSKVNPSTQSSSKNDVASSSARKTSPKQNTARIYPFEEKPPNNDITLHQRIVSPARLK